ncbi:MAG: RidA family protein [Proteobacteria bacterium]|jgi:2-iminobutanoate/2-iminopropanoate deaminase|nr:RidA family protein [Pseudomonadota bacterium]MCE7951503.1 RidA family protein [Xanthomonadales bacterium PRO7]HMM57815.1 RidA family protein [Rudaea sp.]
MHNATNAEPVFHPFTAVPGMPFSEAVEVGQMLFLSGQIGTDTNGKLVGGGIAEETRHALANISRVLARYNSSMERVVKVTVMLADMAEWPAMNTEYKKFFPKNPPVRSAFGCNGLAMNARVEIECIAMRR